MDLYLHIMTRRSKRTNEFITKFHNTTLRYSTDSQQWLWKGGETKFYQVDGEEQLTEIHLTPLHIILKSDFLHQRLDKSEQDWKPG